MNYQAIYDRLIERGKSQRFLLIRERHHIKPVCMGGTDDERNLVDLTPEEHYLAHQLLVKIHPSEHNLAYAAQMMTVGQKRSNKLYGWLKRRYISACRSRVGELNSQFGSFWANDGHRSVKLKGVLPPGYSMGKVPFPKVVHRCACGSEVCASGNMCVRCSGKNKQKITDSQILIAIRSSNGKLSDIARRLNCPNPNNIGELGARIKKLKCTTELVNGLVS